MLDRFLIRIYGIIYHTEIQKCKTQYFILYKKDYSNNENASEACF